MNTASNVSAPAAEDLKLILPPKGTNAGAGVDWIGAGWKLFAKAPVMWIVAMLLLFVIAVVIHLVPIVGSLVFNLLLIRCIFARSLHLRPCRDRP